MSEQVEAQQVDSSETTEEVTADSVADTQPDETQVALEEEASKPMNAWVEYGERVRKRNSKDKSDTFGEPLLQT